jgi:uncharacterized membrane protein YesL
MKQAFGKINLILIVLGAGLGFFGLYLLSLAPVDNPISLNVAPFVIVAGYLVVIPAGILWPNNAAVAAEKKAGQAVKA